jgi:hypothetical protein
MNAETNEKELKGITDFLNVDYVKGNVENKIHVGLAKTLAPEHVQTLIQLYSREYDFVKNEFSGRVPERWLSRR